MILCSHVLGHVRDANVAMRELNRVLSPSGFALLDAQVNSDLAETYEDWTITTPEGRAAAFGQWDHVRWFGRNYPDLLRAAGFLSCRCRPASVLKGGATAFWTRDLRPHLLPRQAGIAGEVNFDVSRPAHPKDCGDTRFGAPSNSTLSSLRERGVGAWISSSRA